MNRLVSYDVRMRGSEKLWLQRGKVSSCQSNESSAVLWVRGVVACFDGALPPLVLELYAVSQEGWCEMGMLRQYVVTSQV